VNVKEGGDTIPRFRRHGNHHPSTTREFTSSNNHTNGGLIEYLVTGIRKRWARKTANLMAIDAVTGRALSFDPVMVPLSTALWKKTKTRKKAAPAV